MPPTPLMPSAPMVQQSAPRPAVHLPTIVQQQAPPAPQMPYSAPIQQLPRPIVNHGISVDGKVKDAIELAAFAISALKVTVTRLSVIYELYGPHPMIICGRITRYKSFLSVFNTSNMQHNDINLAKQRLQDAVRSLE